MRAPGLRRMAAGAAIVVALGAVPAMADVDMAAEAGTREPAGAATQARPGDGITTLSDLLVPGSSAPDVSSAGAVDDVLGLVLGLAGPALGLVGPTLGLVGPLVVGAIGPLLGAVGPLLGPALGLLGPLVGVIGPLLGVVGPLLGPVVGLVGPALGLVRPLLGAVGPLLEPVLGLVGLLVGVTGPLVGQVGPLLDVVDLPVANPTDTLAGLPAPGWLLSGLLPQLGLLPDVGTQPDPGAIVPGLGELPLLGGLDGVLAEPGGPGGVLPGPGGLDGMVAELGGPGGVLPGLGDPAVLDAVSGGVPVCLDAALGVEADAVIEGEVIGLVQDAVTSGCTD